jgi:16S rRNA processing protein RimM
VSNQPTDKKNSFVTIGSVGRTYGTKGWLKINSFTGPSTNIMHYGPWYLLKHGQWQKIAVSECKMHGNALIAHFSGFDIPEQAQAFVNCQIGIKREQLPPLSDGDYYWTDLIGLSVYNQDNQYLGQIDHLFETGANDVLVIKSTEREYLIPYVKEHVVLNIDLLEKIMLVNWDKDF